MLYVILAGTGCKLSGAALHWMVSEPTKTVQLFMALYSDYNRAYLDGLWLPLQLKISMDLHNIMIASYMGKYKGKSKSSSDI